MYKVYNVKLKDIKYKINHNNELTITKYLNKEEQLIKLPSYFEIEGKKYKVTSIGNFVFFGKLTTVVFPDTVEYIGWFN